MSPTRNSRLAIVIIGVLATLSVSLLTYALTSSGAAPREAVIENTREIACVKADIREIKTDVRWIREKLEE